MLAYCLETKVATHGSNVVARDLRLLHPLTHPSNATFFSNRHLTKGGVG